MKLEALLKLPGAPKEFVRQTDTTDPYVLIREYARYMLELAGESRLPVDIDSVVTFHGFRQPRKPAKEQMGRRGFQVGSALAVNTDDPLVVQRFSKGHELTEALLRALKEEAPSRYSAEQWEVLDRMKELLCDYGAAELLLPAHLFFPLVTRYTMKLSYGLEWARDCKASLTATIRRMLDANVAPGIFLIVQERYMRYYGDLQNTYNMLWDHTRNSPWKPHGDAQLHVVNEWHSAQTTHIVKLNEVIPTTTSIYTTFRAGVTNKIECSNNLLDFDYLKGYQHTETLLVKIKNAPTVMTLIRPRDLSSVQGNFMPTRS